MTVSAIIFCVMYSVFILIVDLFIWVSNSRRVMIITAILSTALILGGWLFGHWYCTSTAAGQRAMKTQRSEFGDGIQRELTVYDMNGDVIEHYEGRFDVDTGSDGSAQRILFDDEEGNRHVIYPGGGIVIINEVTE